MKKIIRWGVMFIVLAIFVYFSSLVIGISSLKSWEESTCSGYQGGYSYLGKKYVRFEEEWEEGEVLAIHIVVYPLFSYQLIGKSVEVVRTWIITVEKSPYCPGGELNKSAQLIEN